MRCLFRSFRSLAPALFLLALAGGLAADAVAETTWSRVAMSGPSANGAVRWALNGAARRLATPSCQGLLTEFQDQEGRPLQARLSELNQTPPDYLALVLFRDGSGQRRCQSEVVVAFTAPGYRVVYVCEKNFERHWQRDPRFAEAVLIHEALHTLGLGENPPSSSEITTRVQRLCR